VGSLLFAWLAAILAVSCADRTPAEPVFYTWHSHLLQGRSPALVRTSTGVALAINAAGNIMVSRGAELRFEQVVAACEYTRVHAAWVLREFVVLAGPLDRDDKTYALLSDGATGWTAATTPVTGSLLVAGGPGRLVTAKRVGFSQDDLLLIEWDGGSWATRRLEDVGCCVDTMGPGYDAFEYDLALSAGDELRLATFRGQLYSDMLLWTETGVSWQHEVLHPGFPLARKLGLSMAVDGETAVAFVFPAEQGDRIRLIRGDRGAWRQEDLLDPVPAVADNITDQVVTGLQLTSVAIDDEGATYVATVRRAAATEPYEIVVAHDRTGQWAEEVIPIEPPAGQPDMPPTSLQMVVDPDRAIHLVHVLESANDPYRAGYVVGSPGG